MAEEPAAPVPAGTEPVGPCPIAATPRWQGPAADAQAAPKSPAMALQSPERVSEAR